ASAEKTGRLLVVDSAWTNCGASAEIVARAVERLQGVRDLRIKRLGFAPVTCPTTRNLEEVFYPDASHVASAAYELAREDGAPWVPEREIAREIIEFKGPF